MEMPIVCRNATGAQLRLGNRTFACVLGKAGVVSGHAKREGDMATPAGTWKLRAGFWRADRLAKPGGPLAFVPIAADMYWDDDPASPHYNTLRRGAPPEHPERLLRADHVYDVVVPLGFNDDPIVPGRGSAIFLHVARPERTPTAGCVALALDDLLEALALLPPAPTLTIE